MEPVASPLQFFICFNSQLTIDRHFIAGIVFLLHFYSEESPLFRLYRSEATQISVASWSKLSREIWPHLAEFAESRPCRGVVRILMQSFIELLVICKARDGLKILLLSPGDHLVEQIACRYHYIDVRG